MYAVQAAPYQRGDPVAEGSRAAALCEEQRGRVPLSRTAQGTWPICPCSIRTVAADLPWSVNIDVTGLPCSACMKPEGRQTPGGYLHGPKCFHAKSEARWKAW